jgi:hypothetical protein
MTICNYRLHSDTIWGLPSKEIIQYMRDVFPKDIETENDGKLIDFWFSEECPQIGWVVFSVRVV